VTAHWVLLPLLFADAAGLAPPAPEPTANPVEAPDAQAPAQQAPLRAAEAPAPVMDPGAAGPTPRTASNAIFLEGFGNGLLYSVNYERILGEHFGVRAGFSYFTYAVSSYGKSGNLDLLTVPMVVSYYTGWDDHKIQLGLGATIIYRGAPTDSEGTAFGGERAGAGLAASGVVGYRYLPQRGGFTFGVGFTPLIRASKALAWGGANAGYLF
jgi:hypothetical protein